MLTIDTLRTARTLEAGGFTPAQAEAITSVLADATEAEHRASSERIVHDAASAERRVGGVDANFIFCLVVSQTAVAITITAILHHARGG